MRDEGLDTSRIDPECPPGTMEWDNRPIDMRVADLEEAVQDLSEALE